MATDIHAIVANLLQFFNFENKTIISVGAGGGQFIEYARTARKVYAVDNDKQALDALNKKITTAGLANKFTLIHSEFEQVNLKGDVVLFEFCLHEMNNATAAITKALAMAPELVICDHLPDSEWAFTTGEDQKVVKSWNGIKSFPWRKYHDYSAVQQFTDYNTLYEKIKGQGDEVINRIAMYKGCNCIEIPMSYGFVLI